jgi:hypothetical protein
MQGGGLCLKVWAIEFIQGEEMKFDYEINLKGIDVIIIFLFIGFVIGFVVGVVVGG